jgi:alanyl-tRNA synthetase
VVDATYALPGLHRHVAEVVDGEVVVGQEAHVAIDEHRRDYVKRNHTGTHLLHWALRETLGDHVHQQGSLVAPDHLRFDFSHYGQPTLEELAAVEDLANAEVLANETVRTYETTKDHAEEIGAMAFFGDKYGEIVRVVEAGRHSLELCGGTHVRALGDIGPITITSEGSIGANVRRIAATTGTGTLERLRRDTRTLAEAARALGVPPDELLDGLERTLEQVRFLRKEVEGLRRSAATTGAAELAAQAVDGVVVARRPAEGRGQPDRRRPARQRPRRIGPLGRRGQDGGRRSAQGPPAGAGGWQVPRAHRRRPRPGPGRRRPAHGDRVTLVPERAPHGASSDEHSALAGQQSRPADLSQDQGARSVCT